MEFSGYIYTTARSAARREVPVRNVGTVPTICEDSIPGNFNSNFKL